MRRLYLLAGLAICGVAGLIGWATLGTAQPGQQPSVDIPLIDLMPEDQPKNNDPTKSATPMKAKPPLPGFASQREPAPASPPAPLNANKPVSLPAFADKPKTEPILEPIPDSPTKEPGLLIPIPNREKEEPNKATTNTDKPLTTNPPVEIHQPRNLEMPPNSSKQEPAVSIEWIGQTAVKVGMPCDYTLVVKNTSPNPVQKVIAQVRIPQQINLLSAEPKGEGADGVMMWDLGTLLAKQERRIQMKMMSPTRGDMSCQAWVTFTGSSVMRVLVREPKLLVKVAMPKEVLVGDAANIVMTISNPGDHPAERVKLVATLGEGLESVRGNKLNYDIGMLAAGETRNLQFPCVSKSPGEQKCEAFAEADGGLKATDSAALMVIQPRLDIEVVGPKRRYLDRKAVYSFKVKNPGNAPATNVFITDSVPVGLKFIQADNGGQHDFASRTVKWFIGEVGPGQTREVKAEFTATVVGDQIHKVMAHASRGIKSEQEAKTVVEGLSAIEMDAVATENPIEVGTDTTYEIKVTNAGTGPETDVKLVCTIPPQMTFKVASGSTKHAQVGNEIIFEPLTKLTQRADAVYKVTVTAKAVGDVRFKASLTTATMVEPVIKIVPTKVYEDK